MLMIGLEAADEFLVRVGCDGWMVQSLSSELPSSVTSGRSPAALRLTAVGSYSEGAGRGRLLRSIYASGSCRHQSPLAGVWGGAGRSRTYACWRARRAGDDDLANADTGGTSFSKSDSPSSEDEREMTLAGMSSGRTGLVGEWTGVDGKEGRKASELDGVGG